MSPPNRLPADPTAERATPAPSRTTAAPAPGSDVGSAHAAVIGAQQTAGNRAVTSMLRGGGAAGVQRAPSDDDGGSGATSYAAPSLAPPPRSGTTGATSYAAPSLAPPGGGVPVKGPLTPTPTDAALGGGAAPPTSPLPVPAGMFGGVNPLEKRQQLVAPREVHMHSEADVSYQIRKDSVIRSPNENWHFNAWYHSNNGKIDEDRPTPQVFKVGDRYYVAPDYKGPATDLPVIAAVGNVGLGAPGAPGTGGTAPGGGSPGGPAQPRVLETHGPAPDKLRQAVAPYTPFTGEARGTQKAAPVTFSEVQAAMAADPTRVVRSPNPRWHRQGYRLDGGGREAPGAFKVGDLYVIAPDYPLKGVPPLGQTAPPKPSALPQAAQPVSLAGTTHAEGSTLKSYSAITTEREGRTETRTRSREQGVVTDATEVTEGGMTNRQERQRGAGVGVGGYALGATTGSTTSSKIEGDVVGTTRNRQFNAGVTTDAKLGAEAKATKEIVVGTDPDGNPIKKSTTTKAGGKVDLESASLTASRLSTNEKGTTRGFGAGAKVDKKGNAEVEVNYLIQSRGGLSFKPTVSRGVKVEASDPIKVGDEWEVTYRIADTTGVGAGGGKQFGSGASVGVNVGATEAQFEGGKRSFKTEGEAIKFRDNAAARVASEKMFTPVLSPTTVAGALQIPIGETRTSGDISGKSIGGSAGYSGVAINVGKSTSKTNELAIKHTGTTIVEVTGSVTGSKTGSVGISAPALTHGYSSTNSTSFAVTFEFDLSKEQGRAAFELYCRTGMPPMQTPKVIEKGGSQADNETFTIAGLGSVVWTGTTWQVERQTAGGSTQKVYGGAQVHEQKPGTVGKWIGEDTLKSNASIVRVEQDGEEVGARAQFTVGGTSGEYNRAEFGKIFTGARTAGDTKPSGDWTLSAPVPKENVRELERVSRKVRNALDEKQAYSELVKENGAAMLGGQVGGRSISWDLELKGDSNFPGEKERTRLKQLRKDLMARVRTNPEIASDIVRETGDELAKLAKRREAVADVKKYTDLPDGLRTQQLAVIDMHIDDMKVVRRTAQAVAMKRDPGEKAADVAARVDKTEKGGPTGGAKKAAVARKGAVVDEAQKADLEYARLQDTVSAKESKIAAKRKVVREHSIALGDAIGAKGTTALKFGVDSHIAQVQIGIAKAYINLAKEADKKQSDLEPQIEAARNAWSAASGDRKAELAAIRTLEKLLDDRLKQMEVTLYNIREAGKAVFHITTRGARAGNPGFWNSLGETEGEE